jgi:hypothetical protein
VLTCPYWPTLAPIMASPDRAYHWSDPICTVLWGSMLLGLLSTCPCLEWSLLVDIGLYSPCLKFPWSDDHLMMAPPSEGRGACQRFLSAAAQTTRSPDCPSGRPGLLRLGGPWHCDWVRLQRSNWDPNPGPGWTSTACLSQGSAGLVRARDSEASAQPGTQGARNAVWLVSTKTKWALRYSDCGSSVAWTGNWMESIIIFRPSSDVISAPFIMIFHGFRVSQVGFSPTGNTESKHVFIFWGPGK